MTHLVFFLEEPSAKAMLDVIVPKLLQKDDYHTCIVFEGKQDLEKKLPKRLKGWIHLENTKFIVLRDQDSCDCKIIKAKLSALCTNTGHSDVLIRIACHELESFYLGDLAAVEQAFNMTNLHSKQNNKKFRNPDLLANPVQELSKLIPDYEKVSGSRKIAQYMNLYENKSYSFNSLIQGIQKLLI